MVMVYFIPLVVIVITYSVILFTISRKTSVSGKGPSIIYVSTLGYLVGQQNANLVNRPYLVKMLTRVLTW